jgi:hypothetical protein
MQFIRCYPQQSVTCLLIWLTGLNNGWLLLPLVVVVVVVVVVLLLLLIMMTP